MMIPIWTLAIAIGGGFCIGAAGVGGIILIPALIVSGLTTRQAQATSLFTFLFTGLYGAWLFQRRGSIEWRQALPVCAGAAIFSYLGAWVNSLVAVQILNLVVASIIVTAGAYLVIPPPPLKVQRQELERQRLLLVVIGAAAGFGSGISGAGGPLFLVPMMLAAGFAPLSAIGTGQVLQVVSGFFASLGNFRYGSIDFRIAGYLAVAELAGVFLGVHVAHRAKVLHLRWLVAGLCLLVGCAMFVRIIFKT